MNNPCYDSKTKTSCPDRCAGCSINCYKWDDYLKRREDLYNYRRTENDYVGHFIDRKRRLDNNKRPKRKIEQIK